MMATPVYRVPPVRRLVLEYLMRAIDPIRLLLAIAPLLTLHACSAFPRTGPSHESIASQAALRVTANSTASRIDYALVDISKAILPYFDDTVIESLQDGFGGGQGPVPSTLPGVGDVVQVTIFEAQGGGLFVPEGGNNGNFVTLPSQAIDSAGYVNIPYAGRVLAAGRPIAETQAEIEDKLSDRAIEPQVLITTTSSSSNQVTLLGDVASPSKQDLGPDGERVLDLISRSGGLSTPSAETYVTIVRGGRQATALFKTIVENPRENIFVRPGDTIYVNRERRTYLVFGATGGNGRFNFDESDLTLGEALGNAGGLLDNRADPSQVFLYRIVPRSTLAMAGVDVSRFAGESIPVVFQADLRDPAMFFAVQRFRMQDKDVLYVSNAAASEIGKFLALVNGVSGTASSVPMSLANSRNAFQQLAQ
jgi:polysaccharide biosynthesis/export protein